MAVPVAGPAVALALALPAHLFTPVIRQAVLPLPLAGALGFARHMLNGFDANLGFDGHQSSAGCSAAVGCSAGSGSLPSSSQRRYAW